MPIFEAAKVLQEISNSHVVHSVFFFLCHLPERTIFEEIQIREEISAIVSRCLILCRISCFKAMVFYNYFIRHIWLFYPLLSINPPIMRGHP